MNKNIQELNIPEENKILLSKIDKRINYLSEKTQDYFDNSISISSKKIEDAYSMNEDLISILKKNSNLITKIQEESKLIRIKNQTNFTTEIELKTPNEIDDISIIINTLNKKEEFVNSEDKIYALSKKEKFILNRNKRRKEDMDKAIINLESRIQDEILDISPMKEDIKLIKTYIDEQEILVTRYLYLIPAFITLLSIMLFGGLIWILI